MLQAFRGPLIPKATYMVTQNSEGRSGPRLHLLCRTDEKRAFRRSGLPKAREVVGENLPRPDSARETALPESDHRGAAIDRSNDEPTEQRRRVSGGGWGGKDADLPPAWRLKGFRLQRINAASLSF